MSNSKKVTGNATKVLRSAMFRKGFEEARRGLPLVDMADRWDQWNYERGRLFASCFKGTLKIRNRIRTEALYAFHDAVNCGAII